MKTRIAMIWGISSGLLFTFMIHGQGCQGPSPQQGTSTGNPMVSLKVAGYNPMAKLTPMSVQNLTMCFKRLRLKLENDTALTDNVDLDVGELSISSAGTEIETVELPPGSYDRIEFDLDSDCASGKSLQVTNNNGTFHSTDSITIRFDGQFTLTGDSNEVLELGIQQIVTALQNVNNNHQVESQAESASGSLNLL